MSSGVGSSRRTRVGWYGPTPKYEFVPFFATEGVLRVDRRSDTIQLIPVDKNGQSVLANAIDLEGELRAKGGGPKHTAQIAVAKIGKLQVMRPSYRRGEVKAEVMEGLLTDIKGHFYIMGQTLAVALRKYNGKRVQLEVIERVPQSESSAASTSSPPPKAKTKSKSKSPRGSKQSGPVVVEKVEF